MKLFITILALTVAANASYLPGGGVVSYSSLPAAVAVSSSVWPPNGVYGKTALTNYAAYPGGVYGSQWPVYGKTWEYSAPAVTKVVDNGLWNYGGYGYNKYWL